MNKFRSVSDVAPSKGKSYKGVKSLTDPTQYESLERLVSRFINPKVQRRLVNSPKLNADVAIAEAKALIDMPCENFDLSDIQPVMAAAADAEMRLREAVATKAERSVATKAEASTANADASKADLGGV